MKYLAIETSSKLCGACITEDDILIDKIEIDNGLTHSQNLMPLIQKLLYNNNLKIADIDGFICDIGPGSFTGIRIGVATAKAFVDSFDNKKYTGVNSLEALAYNVKTDGLICSVIDCKNDNCYFALYSFSNNSLTEVISPVAASVEEMCSTLTDYLNSNSDNTITFVGDGVNIYKKILSNTITSIESKTINCLYSNTNNIKTYNLALAGIKKISSNTTLELLPLYLKKPQAERVMETKKSKDNYNNTNNYIIAKMTNEDLNSIKNILTSEFDDFWSFKVLQQEFENDTSHLFIAKDNNNNSTKTNSILGFVSVQFVLDEATITNIVTKKVIRNAGIGSQLLEFIINYCKSNNMKTITLEVNENNISALKLYKKFNFEQIGLRKNYYNNTDNAIIMNLDI